MYRNILQSLIFLFIFSSLFQACSPGNAAEGNTAPPRRVMTGMAQGVDYQTEVRASGRLSAKEEVNLSFKTGGIVHRVLVEEGQQVKAGALLAILKLDEIEAQVEQTNLAENKAQIDLKNAELALRLAERDLRNTRGLYADSVATLEQLENAEVQLENVKNQLEAAQTGLALSEQNQKIADYNLKYSKITAPMSGTILRRLADPNELVGPGQPVFMLGTEGQYKVITIAATDKDVVHLQIGDPATIAFDAYPEQTFKGEVESIAGMADPYTGTYAVDVKVDAAGLKLLSGFVGSVAVHTAEVVKVVAVDAGALVSADGRKGKVFVVKGNKAERREVSIFRLSGDDLLISSGLEAGEQIVTSGAGYLEDGQVVQIIN